MTKRPEEITTDASASLDAAAAVYEHGVYPGDESEATEAELWVMARRVVLRFLEHMSEHYSGDMYTEQACGHLAQMVRDA